MTNTNATLEQARIQYENAIAMWEAFCYDSPTRNISQGSSLAELILAQNPGLAEYMEAQNGG